MSDKAFLLLSASFLFFLATRKIFLLQEKNYGAKKKYS